MRNLSNISITEFRKVLQLLGLHKDRTVGGHEVWSKPGMHRAVIIQTHIDPIPTFVIRKNLKTIGISRDVFLEVLAKV